MVIIYAGIDASIGGLAYMVFKLLVLI
jgi:hypothetical protein